MCKLVFKFGSENLGFAFGGLGLGQVQKLGIIWYEWLLLVN